MDRFMITHSLLSSWLYAMKPNPYDDSTSERDPFDDFLRTLRREPSETTKPMQLGHDFEDLVTAILYGEPTAVYHKEDWKTKELIEERYRTDEHPWYQAAAQIAGEISGSMLQFKAKREIEVNGRRILLYGRLDGLGAGEITDIKYSGNYERGKFYDSTQHPMYFELIPEATIFTYTISNGKEVWHEPYRREETRSIVPIIADFLEYLRTAGLIGVYEEYWKAL